jgi:hypothetical protein
MVLDHPQRDEGVETPEPPVVEAPVVEPSEQPPVTFTAHERARLEFERFIHAGNPGELMPVCEYCTSAALALTECVLDTSVGQGRAIQRISYYCRACKRYGSTESQGPSGYAFAAMMLSDTQPEQPE